MDSEDTPISEEGGGSEAQLEQAQAGLRAQKSPQQACRHFKQGQLLLKYEVAKGSAIEVACCEAMQAGSSTAAGGTVAGVYLCFRQS